MTYIGKPIRRYDGPTKVTGGAKYAADYDVPGLLYGVIVSSAIAKGRIMRLELDTAHAVDGVVDIFSHEKRPDLASADRKWQDEVAPPGSPFRPFKDAQIHYSGQPIALVVASSFEAARHAATLVVAHYQQDADIVTNLATSRDKAHPPRGKRGGYNPPAKPRGDIERGFAQAQTVIENEYVVPFEHHNPMEPFASTVIPEADGSLTIYDKTQGSINAQTWISNIFGLKAGQVHVMNQFVGGAFGSGLRPQHQLFMAVLAALELKRPVRVVLTRQQMFTLSYRPNCIQTIGLGADSDGKLMAMTHDAIANTSQFEEYMETTVNWEGLLYTCPNTKFSYEVAELDLYTPSDMRAPGATTGVYAIEAAMDELAYATGVDPLELRLRNYSEIDQNENKNYTSKALRGAYMRGAERFGWSGRSMAPRSMREGHELIGWGMATGVWEAQQNKCSARITVLPTGHVIVSSAATDIGTGTYTIMAQMAAEGVGVPIEMVTVKLGDSSLPYAPIEGGSWMAASIGCAIQAASLSMRKTLLKQARGITDSPLANASIEQVVFADGLIRSTTDDSRSISVADAVRASGKEFLAEEETTKPHSISSLRYSRYTHSAIFVEVRVDEELGVVRVTRVVDAVAAGRILNTKTARSQILGGVVMGISMALHEETFADHNLGRFMNHTLAEYHIPVNADIHDIDVIFVDEPDEEINDIGVKGLGEIGIVGTAAAVANAIFHATGKRVRDLPITPDKLL
ncbi:MAG: xanthine dehydrogenase family protein molybdopterin-binding subunit [Janthinobacterium lividum]